MKLSIRLALLLEEFIDADATACAQHFRGLYLHSDYAMVRAHTLSGMEAAKRWRLAHDFLWLLQSDAKRLPAQQPSRFPLQELVL